MVSRFVARPNLRAPTFQSCQTSMAGVNGDPARPDNIIFNIADDPSKNPDSAAGFGYPNCIGGNAANEVAIASGLPAIP